MDRLRLEEWKIGKTKCDYTDSKEALLECVNHCQEGELLTTGQIAQIHEILMRKGIVSDKVLEDGDSSMLSWVAEYDWFYRTDFTVAQKEDRYVLTCKGLDTVCDLFLNGTYLGLSESMYLPFEKDVTDLLRVEDRNTLVLYFHGHEKMLRYYKETMPEEYAGHVPARAMLLKAEDYGTDPKNCRGYWNIGIFDEVCVEGVSDLKIRRTDIDVKLGQPFYNYDRAVVTARVSGTAWRSGMVTAEVTVCEADGSAPVSVTVNEVAEAGEFCLQARVTVENPKLWWPVNYGDHPLYRLQVRLIMDGKACGEVRKPFGIRDIRQVGNMMFTCNGVPVRLFGADIAPIYGPSNVFHEQTAFALIDRLCLAGMNVVRIWGPNKPYPDRFYDRFDELGILVWQDFPTGGSELPCDDHYRELLMRQAEEMLCRLKHHPSIYLWCGGNENIYMNEYFESSSSLGYDILTDGFRKLCTDLDPSRTYHVSCPYGGRYTNDPEQGDSHGSRAYRRFLPGEPYGVFYSENIRVYPPQYKSMKRLLGAEIWDENYLDVKRPGCRKPMPDAWAKRLGNFGEEKFGPIHEYYAADGPEDLIYKYTAAASQDIYQMYARARRGKPHYKSTENNFCQGFMIWKSNDPWPNFYCALVDYYGECAMTYYAVKRAIRPVWIDLEVDDRIYLWGVNDTGEDFRGTVTLTLFRMDENRIVRQVEIPAALLRTSSGVLTNLDFFGAVHWHTVVHAVLRDENDTEVCSTSTLLRHENMLPFPDAALTLEAEGDTLIVRTDCYARCVELSAGEAGEGFGWVFADNFFDLLPFETKRVAILRRGEGTIIRAKAQYGSHSAVCDLEQTGKER